MYKKYIIANDGELKDTIEFSVVDIKSDSVVKSWDGDKLASYSFIEKNLKSLTGRILTIVDASLPAGVQNRCVKDLIRKEFIYEFEKIGQMMFDKKEIDKVLEGADMGNIQLCDSEEILGA